MTPKQQQLFKYLKENIIDGVCPSFEDMRKAMGLASKSGVHRLVKSLEEQGRITRMKHRARAIEIVPEIDPNNFGVNVTLTMLDGQIINFISMNHPDTIRGKFNRSPYVQKIGFKA